MVDLSKVDAPEVKARRRMTVYEGLGRMIGGFLAVLFTGFLGWMMIFYVVALLAGAFFSTWYLKSRFVNHKFVQALAWSNVLTWLLPPLGVFTATVTLIYASYYPGYNKTFRILGFVCFAAICLVTTVYILTTQ